MAPLACHIPVFNIDFPQLVWPLHDPVVGYLFGYGIGPLPLGTQQIQFFAQPVYLLLVDHQAVFSPQQHGKLSVSTRPMRTLHQPPQKRLDAGIRYEDPVPCIRESRNGAATVFRLLGVRMLEAVVVRGTRHMAQLQHGTNRISFGDPEAGYFQSGYFFFTKSRKIWSSSSFSPKSFIASLYLCSIS